jgi:hypothetical protein
MRVVRRVAKAVPFLGTALAVYFLRDAIKKKGTLGGVIHSGLDAVPYFGALKNGIELFTDDWVPDLPASERVVDTAATAVREEVPAPTSRTPS